MWIYQRVIERLMSLALVDWLLLSVKRRSGVWNSWCWFNHLYSNHSLGRLFSKLTSSVLFGMVRVDAPVYLHFGVDLRNTGNKTIAHRLNRREQLDDFCSSNSIDRGSYSDWIVRVAFDRESDESVLHIGYIAKNDTGHNRVTLGMVR